MQPFPGRGLFFLLRHGSTDWNVERRVMGRRAVDLNDLGRSQIAALAPYLSGLGIAQVWTSPLARARSSAEIAGAALGVPIFEDEGLTEVDYGDWEAKTFPELLADPRYREFQRDPVRSPVPGGESLLDVRERVYGAMERVARRATGEPVLVVSHGDPLRVIVAGCLCVALEEMRRLRLDNGALSGFELTGDWAEVKFVNMRPDLAVMIHAERDGARAVRELEMDAGDATS